MISKSEVMFEDLKLNGSGYGSYRLSGRIGNKSPHHKLSQVTLTITMSDCTPLRTSDNAVGLEEVLKRSDSAGDKGIAIEVARAINDSASDGRKTQATPTLFMKALLDADAAGRRVEAWRAAAGLYDSRGDVRPIRKENYSTYKLVAPTCVIIGQTSEDIYVDIPPMQARDLDRSVYLRSTPRPNNTLAWDYGLSETTAQ